MTAIYYRPELLGVGIGDNTATVAEGHTFTVVVDGRVAVYDGAVFDLTTRAAHWGATTPVTH